MPDYKSTPSVRVGIAGMECRVDFQVVEPEAIRVAGYGEKQVFALGLPGAGARLDFVTLPDDVSFYNVVFSEPRNNASNREGYFSHEWFNERLGHNTAGHWTPIDSKNQFVDRVYILPSALPRHSGEYPWGENGGSFKWSIPTVWRVKNKVDAKGFPWTDQVFSIDTNGTVRIEKFNGCVSRGTNVTESVVSHRIGLVISGNGGTE